MKTGVIDIGTNTFNLLIKSDQEDHIFSERFPVKLGEGGINQNKIVESAYNRGIDALIRFKHILMNQNVEVVWAFATSAVRGATNGAQFVEEAFEKTGIRINVINGLEEANFVYEGVKNALRLDDRPILMLDIGGGSNEFIIANNSKVFWSKSYDLGVARMLEKFAPSDPITKNQIKEIQAFYQDNLEDLWQQVALHKPHIVVGSSGSFETLFNICLQKFKHKPLQEKDTYGRIYLHEFNHVHEHLLGISSFQRVVLPGMAAMRAETIHLASILIQIIIEKTGIDVLLYSKYALKEGVIYADKKEMNAWQTSSL